MGGKSPAGAPASCPRVLAELAQALDFPVRYFLTQVSINPEQNSSNIIAASLVIRKVPYCVTKSPILPRGHRPQCTLNETDRPESV